MVSTVPLVNVTRTGARVFGLEVDIGLDVRLETVELPDAVEDPEDAPDDKLVEEDVEELWTDDAELLQGVSRLIYI